MYAIRSYYVLPVQIQADPWAKTLERVAKTPHKMVALFRVDEEEDAQHPLYDIMPRTGCVVRILVITSYSIHYTKLYESISVSFS